MSLAEIFYLLGIIVYISWLLMIIVVFVAGYYMYKRLKQLEQTVNEKLSPVNSLIDTMRKPSVQTLIAAGPVIGGVLRFVQSIRGKKRR